jgi:hypothetical protein
MSRPRSTGAATGAARAVAAAAAPEKGLALHEAAARAQTLLHQRARLLRDVQKKKLQLERAQQKVSRDAAEAVTKMAPFVERHDALLSELTALFDELLAAGRLSARAHKQVVKIRRSLELQGVLPPLNDAADEDPSGTFDDGADEPWRETNARGNASERGNARPGRAPHSSEPEVAGAKQVGQGRRSVRELFRSLARAVHPDQARHETERERRTEVMKEVTRAYEEGDLARLLELESAWQNEQAVSEHADSFVRCRELERINRELLDQVRQLTREIRDTKRQAFEGSMGLSPDELTEQAERELDKLEEIRDLIRKFRDGKLTLNELARGPRALLSEDELALLERIFFDDFADFATAAPHRTTPRQRRPPRRR